MDFLVCIHIQMFIEQQARDEALGREDEMLMVQPPWRRPHHYWLMHQERKKRKRGKYLNVDVRNICDYIFLQQNLYNGINNYFVFSSHVSFAKG